MSVISREMISDNFIGVDLSDSGREYDKSQLSEKIDRWKYLLVNECNAKKGDKILIGISTINVDFLALCFAIFELSLVLVIADQEPVRVIGGKDIVNPKISSLMPLDIIIWEYVTTSPNANDPMTMKFKYFREHCDRIFMLNNLNKIQIPEDISEVSSIRPDVTDVLMLTTSSGSTGTAKIIEHNHEFFHDLCVRNSTRFSGNVIHHKNMHHGSSLSVFYLPSLASDAVEKNYFLSCYEERMRSFVSMIRDIDLNHISFPYVHMLNSFVMNSIEQDAKFPNMRVSLLTYIPSHCKEYIAEGYFSEVESIFGSNETAGPVFLSTLNKENLDTFENKKFYKPDDFYRIELIDNELNVTLPVYDKTIRTNDLFNCDGNNYYHNGRSDLVRINDVQIDFGFLERLCSYFNDNILLITDDVENKLYLLIEKNSEYDSGEKSKKLVKNINARLKVNFSSNLVFVDKYDVADFAQFITGVKIDRELIRDYFRNHV